MTQDDILVKKETTTDPTYGCPPEERKTEDLLQYGVVTLNKPKGPTSHMCADYVKQIFNVSKAGHGGTLDPGVTGTLPVTLGASTRVVQALLPAGKEYVCIMHLHAPVDEATLRDSSAQFLGTITQLPPVKSAVKRQERQRNIYYLHILEVDGQDVLFQVGCQAGTYIRKLCHDWGRALGTGAHMAELIRTRAGPFVLDEAVTLQDLEDAYAFWKEGNDKFIRHCIKPVELAVQHLPHIWVQDNAVDSLCHGARLSIPGIAQLDKNIHEEDLVAIMTLKGELIGLGEAQMNSQQIMNEDKGVAVHVHTVLMKIGTYSSKAAQTI